MLSVALACIGFSVAQNAAAQATAELPPSRPLRFDEDWSKYCKAKIEQSTLDLKCIEIGGDTVITLGGTLRERIEIADSPLFGIRQPEDRPFLHRALVHADIRTAAPLRGFIQLQYLESSNRRNAPPATDTDRVDVAQAFIDVTAPVLGGTLTVRPGRQEMPFGSSRIISVRDGPNARLSFTGVRAFWQKPDFRIDAIFARPVDIKSGTFDNSESDTQTLWGVYATGALSGPFRFDAYYLGFRNERARFANAAGNEERHSFGVRMFGNSKGLDWNAEGLIQRGEIGSQSVRAWTIATDTGYTFSNPLQPRIGLKANIASGDGRVGDGRLGTFNALYPRFPYFSEATLIAPANFYDLQPSLSIKPKSNMTLSAGWNGIWRQRLGDAVYLAPLIPVAGTAGARSRKTADQWIASMQWRLSRHLVLDAQYVRFTPEGALAKSGGRSGDFSVISVNAQF